MSKHNSTVQLLKMRVPNWETAAFNKKIGVWIWQRIFLRYAGKRIPDLFRTCDNDLCGEVIHVAEVEDSSILTKEKLQGYGRLAFELMEWDIDFCLWRFDKNGNHVNKGRSGYSYLNGMGTELSDDMMKF